MSKNHEGPWHYYQNGAVWRVGDVNDDFVTSFLTEAEAQKYVRDHNNHDVKPDPRWKY